VIHRLSLPTPFAVGRVNCWLVDDDPLTLVDTGPNSGKALDELEQGLAALGRRIEDLERIVLTHQHMDHIGLAAILARRSGAEVSALAALAPWLAGYGTAMEADDAFAEAIMRRNGIPADVATALRAVTRGFRGWGASVEVGAPLADGDELAFASRRFRVLHRPGHSPSDTVLLDEADGTLLGGDHLLPDVSSNPLVTRPLDGETAGDRPKALVTYIASLRATRELPIGEVLPGHGDAFHGHRELIDERLRMHDRRKDRIAALVAERPRTAYELAQALWGDVAITQAYLTLSEVLGHVDLLLDDGAVAADEQAGVVQFTATR
jgi:glyoxylase-like metal-dependent hydrolase (beta-lactamase superfamily II)